VESRGPRQGHLNFGGLPRATLSVQPAEHQNYIKPFPSLIVELSHEKLTPLHGFVMRRPRPYHASADV
jgi:hypothetical protein